MTNSSIPNCGIVFVATGADHYFFLAQQAARSVKRHSPSIPIDLFSDKPRDSDAFDKVHVLDDAWVRSKIDAIKASRFDRTLYLDSDLIVLADISDVFTVLDRFDIALTHDPVRNTHFGVYWKTPLPNSFPTMNGGVIAIRKSDATKEFLDDWKQAVQDFGTGRDQPTLRELLWAGDLRIATLPEEYNMLWPEVMRGWKIGRFSAPRIIHAPMFHRNFRLYSKLANPVSERVGRLMPRLELFLAADQELAHRAGREPYRPDRYESYRLALRVGAYLPRRALQRLKRLMDKSGRSA